MRSRPDVLVLGGGGVLGEAWLMGVLAGIEDGAGLDLRECEAFVGTSAGALVAAHLVAGRPPRRRSSLSSAGRTPGRAHARARPTGTGRRGRGSGDVAVGAARRAGRPRWPPAPRSRRSRSGWRPPAVRWCAG